MPGPAPLLVLREQRVVGADAAGDVPPLLASFGDPNGPGGLVGVYPAREAFERCYDHDAHIVQYALYHQGEGLQDRWCRINMSALAQLAEADFEPRATVLLVDLDTNPRLPWTTDGSSPSPEVLVPPLVAALNSNPLLSSWFAIYLTKKGIRIVYRLLSPIPVVDLEPYTCGLYALLAQARGPGADDTLKLDWLADWTRLYRLPRVVRDGESLHATEIEFQDRSLDLLAVTPSGKPRRPPGSLVAPRRYEGSRPAEDDVEINFAENGKWAAWRKVALRALAGTAAGMVAAGKKQLVEGDGQHASGRNNAIHEHVGQAMHRLYQMSLDPENAIKQETDPERIYGLFLPAVQQFAPDESSNESWPDTLWSAVTRLWAKEAAKFVEIREAKLQREVAKTEEAETATTEVIRGFSTWCFDPAFTQAVTQSEKLLYISRRLVATPGGQNYFSLQTNGYYSPYACSKETLVAHMTSDRVGMHKLVDFEKLDKKGEVVRISAQEVIDRFAVIVRGVKGGPKDPRVPGGTLIQCEDYVTLSLPLFSIREDLEPTYSAEAQGWLESFGHPELLDWIAKALDLDLVMTILSIMGPPSIGKAMLMRALAECTPAETVASDRDFGTFSPKFMETPFLYVNEGVGGSGSSKEISAIVRDLTGGEPIEVNRKFKAPIDVENNLRIVVTANNDNVVTQLLGQGHDLTQEDREALLLRLVHLDVTDAPARYLKRLGGRAYTAKDGAKWIRGKDRKNDYVLARHFLWLRDNHPRMPMGDRFAMQGKVPARLLKEMNLRGGTTPVIIENLLRLIESPASAAADGFVFNPAKYPDRILITASALVDFYKATSEGSRNPHKINANSVGAVLKTLRAPGSSTESREITNDRGVSKKTRWWEILFETLLTEAEDHGYKCEKTKKAYEDWRAKKST